MPKNILPYETLVSKLHYDSIAGIFTWLADNKYHKLIKAGDVAGCTTYHKYRVIVIDTIEYKAHVLAWIYTYKVPPINDIDHINGIRDDNRIENLRDVTRTENMHNKCKHSNNTSGTTGVAWDKGHNSWRVRINHDGKRIHIGRFKTLAEAQKARADAELQYDYHPNHGR